MSDFEAVVRWYIVLSVCAIAVAPLVWWLSAGLSGARHSLVRALAPVVVAFIIWWPAALTGAAIVTRAALVLGLMLLGIAGWAWLLKRRPDLLPSWVELVTYEALWLVAFLGYLWFRSFNPDIANTEKPMEIALLSSVARSLEAPAPDPWFAGEAINYYYFGYQMIGSLAKLSSVPTSIAFNLALGTLFASLLTVVAGTAFTIVRTGELRRTAAIAVAALAAFFVALAGNLDAATRFLRDPGGTLSAGWWQGTGWNASRIITDIGVHGDPNPQETINEFPAFAFVLGDLHPHVLSYPLLACVVAICVGFLIRPASVSASRMTVAGALAGVLYAANSWDAPLALALLLAAAALALRERVREHWKAFAAALAGAIAAAIPFAIHFTAPVGVASGDVPEWVGDLPIVGTLLNTFAVVTWRPSSTSELLTVHGVWIALFALFAAWSLTTDRQLLGRLRRHQELALVTALVAVAIAVAWAPAVIWLGVPAIVAALIAWFEQRTGTRIAAALFAVGFGLALIPEFLYLQDAFSDRMNTVFKLYFQAWLLLALASALGVAALLTSTSRRWLAGGVLAGVVALFVTAPYTPISAVRWSEFGGAERGLDGFAYIERYNQGDADAIEWIDQQASDGDVLVEVPGCGYGTFDGVPMNRVSAFTGVPTILGWSNHEGQWRRGVDGIGPIMDSRNASANAWLDGTPPGSFAYPEPRFVVFGPQEMNTSPSCELLRERSTGVMARLSQAGWQLAFEADETRIYARSDDPVFATGASGD